MNVCFHFKDPDMRQGISLGEITFQIQCCEQIIFLNIACLIADSDHSSGYI